MAAPVWVSSSVDLFAVAHTSVWNAAANRVGAVKCTVETADTTQYRDTGSGSTGNGTVTIVSPLEVGAGILDPLAGKVSIPSGYVVDSATGLLPNVELDDKTFTVTGITSATFNLCTLNLRLVFSQAVDDQSAGADAFAFTTVGGDGFRMTGGVPTSGDGTTTLVYPTETEFTGVTSGKINLLAGAWAQHASPFKLNIPVVLATLTEDSGITSATFDLGTHKLTVVYKQIETEGAGDVTKIKFKTAAGIGYDVTGIDSGDGGLTHVCSTVAGTGAAVAGTIDLGAHAIEDANAIPNLAISGFALSETGSSSMLPPTIPVYDGPVIRLRPISVERLGTATGNPWTNMENLVGAANGSFASFSIPATLAATADSLYCHVAVPGELLGAQILGYAYTLRAISNTKGMGITGISFIPVDVSGVHHGGAEAPHEFGQVSGDWGMFNYSNTEMAGGLGADRITTFAGATNPANGVNRLLFSNVTRMSDLGGFRISPLNFSAVGGVDEVRLDSADIDVYYSPAPRGDVTNLTIATVTTVSAATAGIALDALWGGEITWSNISRALVLQASSATSSADATQADVDQATQTEFVKFGVAAGALAGVVGKTHRDFQVVWYGRASGGDNAVSGGTIDCVLVGELALTKSDGTVLIKAVGDSKLLYDAAHWKVYDQGDAFRNERGYALVMDISGLSGAQVTDMNDNGFYILLRFNIATQDNTSFDLHGVLLNGITAAISVNETHSLSRGDKELLLLD